MGPLSTFVSAFSVPGPLIFSSRPLRSHTPQFLHDGLPPDPECSSNVFFSRSRPLSFLTFPADRRSPLLATATNSFSGVRNNSKWRVLSCPSGRISLLSNGDSKYPRIAPPESRVPFLVVQGLPHTVILRFPRRLINSFTPQAKSRRFIFSLPSLAVSGAPSFQLTRLPACFRL